MENKFSSEEFKFLPVSFLLVLLFLPVILHAHNFSEKDFKIITSSQNYILIEYRPIFTDTTEVKINNVIFRKAHILMGEISEDICYGEPAAEVRTIPIAVPGEFGNTVEVIETEYREIEGRLIPKPRPVVKNNMVEFDYELSDNYYRKDTSSYHGIVGFGGFGYLREMAVQSIVVRPVEFSAGEVKLRLYTRILLKVNYSFSSLRPPMQQQQMQQQQSFISDAVVNYSQARQWISSALTKEDSQGKEGGSLLKSAQKFNSVLSQGRWYRFEAQEEGIYKLTAEHLRSIGLDPSSIDPKTIRIFNNGAKPLPESVVGLRPVDLQENSLILSKSVDDSRFNSGDYILFYARGIHFWDMDSTKKKVIRYFHPYSKSNYYYLTFGSSVQKKAPELQSLNQTEGLMVSQSTQAYASWEQDMTKVLNSGRQYVGDQFGDNQTSRTYMSNLSGIIPGSKINYKISFVNRAEAYSGLRIEENSASGQNVIYNGTLEGLGFGQLDAAEGYRGIERVINATLQPSLQSENSILKFTYTPNSSPSTGYLNYFEISYTKLLKAYSDQIMFFSPDTSSVVEYRLSGFSNTDFQVYDISDYKTMRLITNASKSGGDCRFQVQEQRGRISKYIALGSQSYKSPQGFTEVSNSNLHGMADEGRLIIITHSNFLSEARRLKAHKESLGAGKAIQTVVVDVQDIFDEFSCGMQDVSAIRDFIKYGYDNWTIRPEYVLLFGDGDYDYKDVEGKHQNFVIPYESEESLHNINSYAADDFYACVSGKDNIVDVALGRINITTIQEAQAAVDKIIKYETNVDFGIWRNLITLVADDAYTSSGYEGNYHNVQSEDLANNVISAAQDQKKIYQAQYPTQQTSSGRRKPQVNQAIIDAINSGTLIINWIGHGNPDVWAHEFIFEKGTTIPQLVNDKLCFLTAATCDFGRYDTPEEQSSTELMLIKPDGGIIGAFTSARTVYSSDNAALNNLFYSKLLSRDSTGLPKTVGKSYMLTKMERNQLNDVKYHLFGDPTIRLLVPQMAVKIDSINGIDTGIVQVKALSRLSVSGSVRNQDNQVASDMQGECLLSVFDSERLVPVSELGGMNITLQGGLIYKGRLSVTNGRFRTEFSVPKDISYENKQGKIEAYVQSGLSDGLGFTKNITVGGTDTSAHDDKKGPEISISFDDIDAVNSSSSSAQLIRPSGILYVRLSDETGLNLTGSGIGHRLEAEVTHLQPQQNNNKAYQDDALIIDLTGYFTGELNSAGRSGLVRHQFTALSPGDYTIRVKAWDVFNNPSELTKRFTVTSSEGLVLKDVYNYPNPFKDMTTFSFQSNLDEPLEVKIKVYSTSGRMIRQLEGQTSQRFVRLDWDGRDQDGQVIANGTYLYKLIVRTISQSYSQEVLGKLAIIR